ncbi:rhomboid family intramembrane serine protease [Allofustis seminis]|uniref:rhomboid family intramembrane serine protease n=1 Tax=Allofustis seminis TaxID=166939 RepID=UPI000369A27A|nr:rhomboid family intramembrane serine protease [Allofustis seminis]
MITIMKNRSNIPYVTYGILILCTLMYLLMEIYGGSQNPFVLIHFGAKVNELIIEGQYWRLLTPVFLHIGLSHLVMNGLAIYFLGKNLEEIFGSFRYLLLFLLAGIAGNVASFATNQTISAGASTSIFGMFATVLALAKVYPRRPYFQMLAYQYRILIIVNIIFSLFSSGIDIAGHFGGAIGGYLATMMVVSTAAADAQHINRMKYIMFYVVFILICFFVGKNM